MQTEQVRTWKHAGGNREKDDWEVGAETSRHENSHSPLLNCVTSAGSDGAASGSVLHANSQHLNQKAREHNWRQMFISVTLQHPGQRGALKGMGEH